MLSFEIECSNSMYAKSFYRKSEDESRYIFRNIIERQMGSFKQQLEKFVLVSKFLISLEKKEKQ